MSTFRMNTGSVHQEGLRIAGYAEDFGVSRRNITSIVERILASEYTSDDAKAIAAEIKRFEPTLNLIQNKLEAHGNFGMRASNQTMRTQEEIISSLPNN